ncbi:MAG: hypothetical protein ACLPVF_15875 [Acidimicrobiales bacterium]
MRRLPVIVVAVTLSLAATSALIAASPGVSAAAGSLQSRYRAAIAYAETRDVHYVSKASQTGVVLRVVGNTGATSGTQSLTVKHGSTVEDFTVSVIGPTAYLEGNAVALSSIIGLTAAQSTSYADRWLSFPVGNATLDQLISGLLDKDVSAELALAGPYTQGSVMTIGGHRAQGIKGFTSDTSGTKVPTTLYVESGAVPRPLLEVTSPGKGSTDPAATVTFTHWGQTTHVTTPAGSVSLLGLIPAG